MFRDPLSSSMSIGVRVYFLEIQFDWLHTTFGVFFCPFHSGNPQKEPESLSKERPTKACVADCHALAVGFAKVLSLFG